jgi:hypothetical protein
VLPASGGATPGQGEGEIGAGRHGLRLQSLVGPGERDLPDAEQILLRTQRLDGGYSVTSRKDHERAFENVVADSKESPVGSHHLDPIGEKRFWLRARLVR